MAAVTGLKEIQRRIKRFDKSIMGALRAALYQEGIAIDALSVRECPVDFGRLRATHFVAPPSRGERDPVVEMGYGTKYAEAVHERTDARHNPPTKAKYLQDPMEARKSGYRLRLAKRVRDNIERGIEDAFHGLAPTKPQDIGPRKNRRTTRKAAGLPKGGRGSRLALKGAR